MADDLGEAARVRGTKVSAARLANSEWERSHPKASDPSTFARDVLPTLAGITATRLAVATGLSRQYCRAILQGKRQPHPRWWELLSRLVAEATRDSHIHA